MQQNKPYYFRLLKEEIVTTMQRSYPGINPDISAWKGQEITDFQEELTTAVNAHLSEKWFYTHMKADHPTPPRIDVLNLLSRYAGYANWDDFVHQKGLEPGREEAAIAFKSATSADHSSRYFYLVPLLVLAITIALYGIYSLAGTREYRIRFYDGDTHETVTGIPVSVRVTVAGESPLDLVSDTMGYINLRTAAGKIVMIVSSPYYCSDTITRILKKFDRDYAVPLRANDYALMLHYFSNTLVADWEKRRSRLQKLIEDSALICQVISYGGTKGLELLTKDEFIDRLTMPSGSLKHLEILDTRYRNDRITVLKFRINPKQR